MSKNDLSRAQEVQEQLLRLLYAYLELIERSNNGEDIDVEDIQDKLDLLIEQKKFYYKVLQNKENN